MPCVVEQSGGVFLLFLHASTLPAVRQTSFFFQPRSSSSLCASLCLSVLFSCFFVFFARPSVFLFSVFLFFRLFLKKKKRRKKMHLVSWYPILLSRATTTRVQKQEMKNSSRRLGSFSFFGRRPSLRGSFFSLFPLLFVFFFFVFLFLSFSHPPLRLSTTTIKKKTKKKKNNNNNAREKVVSIDATACARERERKKGRGGARDLSEIVGRVPAA